ncbi:MAG: NnrS family protein [Sulfurospirillaceae bacterium]|nr:NnrS family protein [Sulfurospirillaceae bacterium]
MQQFTTQPPLKKPQENYFLSQPHQPFFVLGVIWAIVTMVIFMLGFKGTISLMISPIYFHIYSLVFIVFSQFFLGFLLTTFPRFCASLGVSKKFYLRTFFLYELGALGVVLGLFLSEDLLFCSVGVLLLLHGSAFYQLYQMYKHGKSHIKKDPFWILVAYGFGLLAHSVFALGFVIDAYTEPFYWYDIAYATGFYLYAIFLTTVIALRMVPFFSHVQIHKIPKLIPIVFTLFMMKALAIIMILEWLEIMIDIVLGLFILKELLRWELPLKNSPAILSILHLALFWLPLGLIFGAIGKSCELYFDVSFISLDTHLLALGFLNTIFIGFGTRVTLGHSSQPPRANRFTVGLFVLTQIVLAIRVLYSITSGLSINAAWTFDLSISAWLILFIAWGIYYGPVLMWGKKIV